MARILFVFATTDGHTARVAQEVADDLRHLGHTLNLVDVRSSS
jgi:menaquinone-dependent protoporphyrinogen IX oxidase